LSGQLVLFDNADDLPVNAILESRHYLGPCDRYTSVYRDDYGLLLFASPTSRHIPQDWLELVRWCILGGQNAGSKQWTAAKRWLLNNYPSVSTVVSYSDPSAGHTGALYRASGWLWAPTWHRLRPSPTGNGSWGRGRVESVKDRWIFPLRRDATREAALRVDDPSIVRRWPWAEYREPCWHGDRFDHSTGGADYRRFKEITG
jgi:hypothetical protein